MSEPEGKINSLRKTMRKLSGQLPDDVAQRSASQYEADIESLQGQVRTLEEEMFHLHRRLEQTPKEFEFLRNKLSQSREQLDLAQQQNERLVSALGQAKEQIGSLRAEVDKLAAPPSSYGTVLRVHDDRTVDVWTGGRKLLVNVTPGVKADLLQRGQEVILNEALNIVGLGQGEHQGEIVRLKDRLDEHRVMVTLRADEERVVEIAADLDGGALQAGDLLRLDARAGVILERLPKAEVEDLVLEEVPNITYADVGGLAAQIDQIRDAIELPVLYAEHFAVHKLTPPKGVLLYGPPGCGKTLIAKAVANALAQQLSRQTGVPSRAYFLNVKGPELLNKYVGETERKLREIFARAREKASAGAPVVVFFDEMDSLFRTRGSGISSDVESTIVPQFLAELDGVEGLRHVIVIGASNRQDLIDPAVLRPGRFDVKIRIDRPNQEAAREIFAKYLSPDLPYATADLARHGEDPAATAGALIDEALTEMFAVDDAHRFLEVTYASGEKETLYFKDFVSGAMIESVCTRAKKSAVKRMIATGVRGITAADLTEAVKAEFRENEDLPNTTNPDDWAKIAGRRGERIVHVRPVFDRDAKKPRKVETISTGHYL
ncbi:MAG TPA: proteasome ATPase [Candidatus Baltobacteraceae bacterium]|nr:proteasome ATPase [Candidatus Baltobacteraceae bacterium]